MNYLNLFNKAYCNIKLYYQDFMNKNQSNPNKSIELAIKNPNLQSLTQDYGELLIDGMMDDGVLKDIPIVGSVVNTIHFVNSISKHFASKKIYKFLYQLNEISEDERNKKINEINASGKYQSTVGEMIFELLERIESDGKPEIIGKLFAAVIEGKIKYISYLKSTHIIKNIFYYDLVDFLDNYKSTDFVCQFQGKEYIALDMINENIRNSELIDTKIVKTDFDLNLENGITYTKLSKIGNDIFKIGMKQ